MKVKEQSIKTGLKLNIQKPKIMTFSPFMANRWETIETVNDFVFLGSKITVDSDCSHEIKRCLVSDIILLTKVHTVKAMVFPVVMYGRAGQYKRLNAKEMMPLNCGAGEDT